MISTLLFIVFFAALIGWAVVHLSFLVLVHKQKEIFKNLQHELDLKQLAQALTSGVDLSQAGPLIDVKLDQMVEGFKVQIPMAAMFLNGPLADQIKKVAKEELMKALPELKDQLIGTAIDKMDVEAIFQGKIAHIVQNSGTKIINRLAWVGAIIGFFLGILEALLIYPHLS